MKVCVADLIKEKRVLYGVKRLRYVDGHCCSAKRRFPIIEAVGDASDGGKECRGSRMERAETMLGGGGGYSRGEERKNESFKDLRGRA